MISTCSFKAKGRQRGVKKPISELTHRGGQEVRALNDRKRKCMDKYAIVNAELINIMPKGKLTLNRLIKLAKNCQTVVCKNLDRGSIRRKEGMICWFAECWDQIKDYIYTSKISNDLCDSSEAKADFDVFETDELDNFDIFNTFEVTE